MNLERLKEDIDRDPVLSALSRLAKEKSIPLFLVGGYLRDLMLGTHAKDYDFALPKEASFSIAMIEDTLRLYFFRIGKEETNTVTYRILKEEMSVDISFLQGETIEEDLRRRDFTINAMAFSLKDETFHRVERSLEDMDKKLIRAVSDRSIDQDPLRMLRAIRYLCSLEGFTMDEDLLKGICAKKEEITKIPAERIKTELDRIVLSCRVSIGMKFLYESTLLLTLFPELRGLENLGQGEYHRLNVLPHILLTIEKLSWAFDWIALQGRKISLTEEDRLSLSYAALFHDLGKQDTYSKDEKEKVHFLMHESYSCQRAKEIMARLRFSNQLKNKILHLIQHHMRIHNLPRGTQEGALKRLVNQMGDETPLLILHTLADKEASRGVLSVQVDEVVEGHCLRILELYKEKDIVHPRPLINGDDVMALGYAPGPLIGQILDVMLQKQVEGEIKNKEEALKLLREEFGIVRMEPKKSC